MIKFDRSRIDRIAKTIVAHIGYTGNTSTVYLHNYGGGKYRLVSVGRASRGYFISGGKVGMVDSIRMPDKNSLHMHSYEFDDMIKDGRNHNKSILCDMIEEWRDDCKVFDKYSDEELGKHYDDYYGGMGGSAMRESFINARRPDSEFFVMCLFRDETFLSELTDKLIEYYLSNNGSFEGLYEKDLNIVGFIDARRGREGDAREVAVALTSATFFKSNDSSITKQNAADVIFGADDFGYHALGKFTTNLPEKDKSGNPFTWTTAILSASAMLEANGYGKLLYGKIIESDDNSAINASLSYNKSIDAITCYMHKHMTTDKIAESMVHELGHRLHHKFLDADKLAELEKAYNSKKDRVHGLKPGDVVEFADGQKYVVGKDGKTLSNRIGDRITLHSVFLKSVGVLGNRISKINGKDFLYEADGIPSSYALVDFEEFVAECFEAWNYGRFTGDVKKFFDGIFGE